MEYQVIRGGTMQDLVAQVNAAIKAGWRPQGGICHSDYPDMFFQALIRPATQE
jgi:hypothetical protein